MHFRISEEAKAMLINRILSTAFQYSRKKNTACDAEMQRPRFFCEDSMNPLKADLFPTVPGNQSMRCWHMSGMCLNWQTFAFIIAWFL